MTCSRRRAARLIHRNAATRDGFTHYFGHWAARRYDGFPVTYLAYHGSRSRLHLGRDEITLAELADLTPRWLTGRAIHFVARTGARAIAGNTRTVDSAEPAAFDFTLQPELLASIDVRRL